MIKSNIVANKMVMSLVFHMIGRPSYNQISLSYNSQEQVFKLSICKQTKLMEAEHICQQGKKNIRTHSFICLEISFTMIGNKNYFTSFTVISQDQFDNHIEKWE